MYFQYLSVVVERNKPSQSFTRVELKKDSRKTLTSIRQVLRHNRYRKDLKMVSCLNLSLPAIRRDCSHVAHSNLIFQAAVRRASAILKSQKPVVAKRTRGSKKKE